MKLDWRKKLAFALVTFFVVLLGAAALDRLLLGRWIEAAVPAGLVFPPFTVTEYATAEFRFTAGINNLGLRGGPARLRRGTSLRIATIGDSFTYGWGVEDGQSWPRQLEQLLRGRGRDVKVLNLGCPGAGPVEYARIAEKALPLLAPDLVIVGILQDDDLAQAVRPAPEKKSSRRHKPQRLTATAILMRMAQAGFPHLLALTLRATAKTIPPTEIIAEWQAEARDLIAKFTPAERERYDRLDADIRNAFSTGGLNPALISLSVREPDYLSRFSDLAQPETQAQIEALAQALGRIQRAAAGVSATVIVVSIPIGSHVSLHDLEARRRIGFEVSPEMLTAQVSDQAVAQAAQANGLKFFAPTDLFREAQAAADTRWYYEWDGHFNAAGQAFFASSVLPTVDQELGRLRRDGR